MRDANTRAGDPPRPSAGEIRRALAGELSMRARVGYTLLLLTSFTVAGTLAALLITEAALPLRTRVALAAMMGVGFSWTAFAAWALTHRRILFVPHRVIAARMATGFSTLFVFGTLLIGPRVIPGWYWALAVGLVMLGVAVVLLVRSSRRFRQLAAQRAQLELALGRDGGAR